MKKLNNYLDLALASYAASLAVVAFIIAFVWDLTADENLFNKFAPFIASVAIALAPFTYFVRKKRAENSERAHTSENLYMELDNALNALDEEKYPNDFKVVEFLDDKRYFFMNRMLNHDFYDGLVSSGKTDFLPTKTQHRIQDMFQMIKDHNAFIRTIREIEDRAQPGEYIPLKTMKYYEALEKIEIELLVSCGIPKLKEKLEEWFKLFTAYDVLLFKKYLKKLKSFLRIVYCHLKKD